MTPTDHVSEGWVLVPEEPTREMWAAAGDAVVRLQSLGVGHHDKIIEAIWAALRSAAPTPPTPSLPAGAADPVAGDLAAVECHGLDTPERVCFYEQDFYPLSNFSAFTLKWEGWRFDTLEAAYHWEKFVGYAPDVCDRIRTAPSAHEAFRIAQAERDWRRRDWDDVKVGIMQALLRAKVEQHEYVRRKLLATGDRELVENSWRDDFWGWGPNRDGQNMLGKLWMEVRAELRAQASEAQPTSAGANCETCGGRGEIGGWGGGVASIDGGGGYESEPCPDCAPTQTGEG